MSRVEILVAQQADYDGRCPLCDGMILGYDGKKKPRSPRPFLEPAHPVDLLDMVVALDGVWVHADCAEETGHRVLR